MDEIDRYKVLFEQAPICIHEIGTDGGLLSMNRAGLDMLGVDDEDQVVGLSYLSFVSAEKRPQVERLMERAFAGEASEFEFSVAGPQSVRHFTSCFIPCPNPAGEIVKLIGISADVSQRREAEAELRRLIRAQAVLASCNHSLARAVDEPALLSAICHNLVDPGGYAFAWIGYVGRGKRSRVRMVAHTGRDHDDFTSAAIAAVNAQDGGSACQTAIRTGEPVVVRNIAEASRFAPWRDTALRYGYRSMIALPLETGDRVIGNLSIFSAALDAFDTREVALLAELGRNLGFGIQTVRSRAAEAQRIRQLREQVEKEERERISGILHDVVGQSMQAVNLGLKRIRGMSEKDGQVDRALLDDLIAEVGTAIGDLRHIGKELRPLFLERMDLPDAVRFHCGEIAMRTGVDVHLVTDDAGLPLQERVKEQCFLSFREALGNAVKHAKADRIEVNLGRPETGMLRLRIKDDGVGFDTRKAHRRPFGLGLAMIRERVASMGGRATIRSRPGKGTSVEISIPLITGTAR